MKAIILAGGNGTRLWPLTAPLSKQLLPVFDKPMIYYPISLVMLSGIKEILIIIKKNEFESFKKVLGDGSQWGIKIQYEFQDSPNGIAEALLIGEQFLSGEKCLLVLGDNFLYGPSLGQSLSNYTDVSGAHIFGFSVGNPIDYGVVEIDNFGKVLSLEEKPKSPKSDLAIPGVYFLDESASSKARKIKASSRNELEITSVLNLYMAENRLVATVIPRGTVWLDTGTPGDLQRASQYVQIVEERQGLKIACLEEIAITLGYISKFELSEYLNTLPNSQYRDYLQKIII